MTRGQCLPELKPGRGCLWFSTRGPLFPLCAALNALGLSLSLSLSSSYLSSSCLSASSCFSLEALYIPGAHTWLSRTIAGMGFTRHSGSLCGGLCRREGGGGIHNPPDSGVCSPNVRLRHGSDYKAIGEPFRLEWVLTRLEWSVASLMVRLYTQWLRKTIVHR